MCFKRPKTCLSQLMSMCLKTILKKKGDNNMNNIQQQQICLLDQLQEFGLNPNRWLIRKQFCDTNRWLIINKSHREFYLKGETKGETKHGKKWKYLEWA